MKPLRLLTCNVFYFFLSGYSKEKVGLGFLIISGAQNEE